MNIFAIESDNDGAIDWIKSAQSQDNLRVVKMILESCQILCTVLNEQGVQAPYKSFNPKHPSCLWAAESSANFENLILHCFSLISEYAERFSKDHKCIGVLTKVLDLYDPSRFPRHEPTPLRMAMPDYFKSDSIVESYRKYYASKPKMRYPEDKIPEWFVKYRNGKPFVIIEREDR